MGSRKGEGAEGGGCPPPNWGWGLGRPPPQKFFSIFYLKNGLFWSILMSKCASHVHTCIAYFHFYQYKPYTSYNYMLE